MLALAQLEAKYKAADRAMSSDDPVKAARLFQELVKAEPQEALFRWSLGHALSELKRHRSAISELKEALKLDPQNIAALGLLGRTYMDLGDWRHAEEAIRARLAVAKSPQYYVFLAHVLMEKKRHRSAIECCQQAIELDPAFAEAFLNLGLAYRYDRQFDEAISAFQKAIDLDAKYAAAFRELGLTYHELDKFGLAEAALRHSLALNRHDAWGHFYLALVLQRTGDIARAARHLVQARKNDPKNPLIRKKHDELQRLRSKATRTGPPRQATAGAAGRSSKA